MQNQQSNSNTNTKIDANTTTVTDAITSAKQELLDDFVTTTRFNSIKSSRGTGSTKIQDTAKKCCFSIGFNS